jgi:hypothetical protein
MTLQALNFNFTGFIGRNDLISYKYLFVSQSSALKDKPLCEFLTNLDQAEYRLVSAENQELVAAEDQQPIEDDSGSWDKRVIAVHLSAVAYLGITILFHEKLGLAGVNYQLLKETFHAAGIVACFISFCMFVGWAYAPMHRSFERDRQVHDLMDKWEKKVHQINESRKTRLEEKFNAVRDEYRKLKDASSSLTEKSPQQIQLRQAKRFLKDRVEYIRPLRS